MYRILRRMSRTLGAHPYGAALLSVSLVALVALLDFVTGYEMRLAILYTLPIALATWVGGGRAGALAAAAAVACWGIGFHPNHIYSHPLYYYWEGLMLVATFALFVLLLHHLRGALARADERFLRVLDGLPAGILVTEETSGRLLYANRHFARMVGTPLEQRAAEFEQRLLGRRPRQAADEAPFHYEEVHDERSGHWFLLQSGPIQWEDERRVQLKVLTDVTDRKQATILRRQHEELLHRAARSAVLAEIASTLGHEINQPLMAIATYNDAGILLLEKERPDIGEVVAALKKSRAQVLRASNIVERTRGFLRRREPSLFRSDINAVAREAVLALEVEIQSSAAQVDLELENKLPEVLFDRALIQQVIVNLLRNALEAANDAGNASPRVVLRTASSEHGDLLVSVTDNGPGIPEHLVDDVFTPFFTTKPQGLGLGLSICRSVVEAHAGQFWYSRAASGGATFQFTLPQGTSNGEPR